MAKIEKGKDIFYRISHLIEQARGRVAAAINQEMVILYWNIGKNIKKEIIKSDRAEYGKQIIQSLAGELTERYGKGFSSQNLWYMVQLYEAYPILHALRGEFKGLSWTHIRTLLPLKDSLMRQFYATLCQKEQWRGAKGAITMSLAVDNSILNNPFEEPGEYWIYEEGQPKRMSGRRPAGYYFRTGKRSDAQAALFTEEQFVELELVNKIRQKVKEWRGRV